MYQGSDVQPFVVPAFDEAFDGRMQAHFFRLFLDACDSGQEHPESLRQHGRKINQEMFGLATKDSTQNKKSPKRRQTSGRPCFMDAEIVANPDRAQAVKEGFDQTVPYKRKRLTADRTTKKIQKWRFFPIQCGAVASSLR